MKRDSCLIVISWYQDHPFLIRWVTCQAHAVACGQQMAAVQGVQQREEAAAASGVEIQSLPAAILSASSACKLPTIPGTEQTDRQTRRQTAEIRTGKRKPLKHAKDPCDTHHYQYTHKFTTLTILTHFKYPHSLRAPHPL